MRYAYDSEGYLQKIETDGTDYTFTYDNYGNLLTVKAGDVYKRQVEGREPFLAVMWHDIFAGNDCGDEKG